MVNLFRALRGLVLTERRDSFALVALALGSLFSALLDAVGLIAVMNFVSVFQPQRSSTGFTHYVSTFLGTTDASSSSIAKAGAVLLGVFVLKNLSLVAVTLGQHSFSKRKLVELGERLLAHYLKRSVADHAQADPAHMAQTVAYESTNVITQVVTYVLMLFVETCSALVLCIALVILEPKLIPLVGIVTALITHRILRATYRRAGRYGSVKVDSQTAMLKTSLEGIAGLRESRVLGSEAYFVSRYTVPAASYANAVGLQRTWMGLPKLLLEIVGVLVLSLLSYLLFQRSGNVADVLPVLGALALAALRLMPGLARIITCLGELRHFGKAVELVAADLATPVSEATLATPPAMPFEHSIVLEKLVYRYPNRIDPVLRNISLHINKGESVAFVGGSGAGKTTLIDVVIGLLSPTEGTFRVDGRTIDDSNLRSWRRCIGYVPQSPYMIDASVRENVAFGIPSSEIDDVRVQNALEQAQLWTFVQTLPDGTRTGVGDRGALLSGGQKQRLGIARALYNDPPILVLDEATSALDGQTEKDIVATIESLRTSHTILVIAHRLSTIRNMDRVVMLENGVLVDQGTWTDLHQRSASFRSMVELASLEKETYLDPQPNASTPSVISEN